MRETAIHIEVVSVEEAKRILKREKLLAKRNGKRELVASKKTRKSTRGARAPSTKAEVLTS